MPLNSLTLEKFYRNLCDGLETCAYVKDAPEGTGKVNLQMSKSFAERVAAELDEYLHHVKFGDE